MRRHRVFLTYIMALRSFRHVLYTLFTAPTRISNLLVWAVIWPIFPLPLDLTRVMVQPPPEFDIALHSAFRVTLLSPGRTVLDLRA
jgi:hypothetical protein